MTITRLKKGALVVLARDRRVLTCIIRGRHNDGSITVEDLNPRRGATTRFRMHASEVCALLPRAEAGPVVVGATADIAQ
ncbi:MAG: hypothetical protein WCG92_23135 [Hyphomicrobiales bacterium]